MTNYVHGGSQVRRRSRCVAMLFAVPLLLIVMLASPIASAQASFDVMEATIDDIQNAIRSRRITATELVNLYLQRIKAYNGVCVNQPQGILGPISTIPHAGKVNALITLNLRPATREALGFDARKARSMTDLVDNSPNVPDALETAAALDAQFAATGTFAGPLHGVVLAIKDQYDTYDMRSTAGADAAYANDRPPKDATFVTRLRAAGAIILAKANMGEYASGGVPGTRSSFGGTLCNPYDTERDPGVSSGGSGISVSTNMVTCAIGEESGTSVRMPAKNNSAVGLAPTRELVSAQGMIQRGIVTRVGPICRTVKDVARILDVYAGFDPGDELTGFSRDRLPPQPYSAYAGATRLDGMRIGVIREYMRKDLFTAADYESIDLVDKAIQDLQALGATVIDPGPTGALFQGCVDKVVPAWRNRYFTAQFPLLFPANTDLIPVLAAMYLNPAIVPHTSTGQPSIRNLGPTAGDAGDAKYNLDVYLAQRGDPNIRNITDILTKSNFWTDPVIPNLQGSLTSSNADLVFANQGALQTRFAMQVAVFKCFADMKLDAVVYPTSSVPPAILTAPREPTVNDRPSTVWTQINSRGFPAMTVPAGFTTSVYDRDANSNLVGPIPARLPVGIDILGLPFSEPKLFQIASAYEAATHHRVPPPDFSALGVQPKRATAPRPMPAPRTLRPDELREIKPN